MSLDDDTAYGLQDSDESLALDAIIEECQNGPVSLDSNFRSLVPNIPDRIYKSRTYGWDYHNNSYVQEGSNAKRANGYAIYHMPDTTTGNVMNYVMRYEDVVNYNFSAQRFINTWKITHNIWVQYIRVKNKVYIFDSRPSNARIVVKGKSYINTKTKNGYFTHYSDSAINKGSTAKKILRVVILWVPKLSTAKSSIDEILSGTMLKTGVLHPTERFAKEVSAEIDNLIKPKDHITITGIGSGVKNITWGCRYSLRTK